MKKLKPAEEDFNELQTKSLVKINKGGDYITNKTLPPVHAAAKTIGRGSMRITKIILEATSPQSWKCGWNTLRKC